MIKLPIVLETEPDWQKVLAYAIDKRNQLQALAEREHLAREAYLRPLVLLQAQPHRQPVETLHAEALREELTKNHHIPAEEIAIATGEQRELEDVDLFDRHCLVKYIITQQALVEGWDCSFASVLASVAELRSETRVEQLLGRILRQPEARHRASPELNRAYAYVASRDFGATAKALRDRLVEGAGFEADAGSSSRRPVNRGGARVGAVATTGDGTRGGAAAETPDLTQLDAGWRDKLVWMGRTRH
jgi:type III restriction enzyme